MSVSRIPAFNKSLSALVQDVVKPMNDEGSIYMVTIDGTGKLLVHMMGDCSECEALGAFDVARDIIKARFPE